MKQTFWYFVVLTTLAFVGSTSAFATQSSDSRVIPSQTCSSSSPSRNATKVYEYLEEEGYRPSYTKDNDITVKVDGSKYLILFDSDDDVFFEVVYLFENPVNFKDKIAMSLIAQDKVMTSVKAVRVSFYDDSVVMKCSLFCKSVDSFTPVIERCMKVCRLGAKVYMESIEEQEKEEQDKSDQGGSDDVEDLDE